MKVLNLASIQEMSVIDQDKLTYEVEFLGIGKQKECNINDLYLWTNPEVGPKEIMGLNPNITVFLKDRKGQTTSPSMTVLRITPQEDSITVIGMFDVLDSNYFCEISITEQKVSVKLNSPVTMRNR